MLGLRAVWGIMDVGVRNEGSVEILHFVQNDNKRRVK